MGCHFLLQQIFLTQGSNPHLLDCRQILYLLSHQGSPQISQTVTKTLFHFPAHVCKARFSLYASTKSNIFQQIDGRGRYKNPVAFMKPVTKEAGKQVKQCHFLLNVVWFFVVFFFKSLKSASQQITWFWSFGLLVSGLNSTFYNLTCQGSIMSLKIVQKISDNWCDHISSFARMLQSLRFPATSVRRISFSGGSTS